MRVFGLSLTTKCSLVQFREEVSAERKHPMAVCVCVCTNWLFEAIPSQPTTETWWIAFNKHTPTHSSSVNNIRTQKMLYKRGWKH